MSRASRARRIAATAVYGGGGLAGLGVAGLGVSPGRGAARAPGHRRALRHAGPDGAGIYGDVPGGPLELAMLGDSSAVGLGVDDPEHTPAPCWPAVSPRSVPPAASGSPSSRWSAPSPATSTPRSTGCSL